MEKRKIGIIGIGSLGYGMATVLAEDEHDMWGYEVDAERMKAAEELGIKAASSPKEVAEKSDYIILSLPQSDIVADVCLGKDGIIESKNEGLLVIDTTSGYQPKTIEIGAALKKAGIRMMDAPITGGEQGGGSISAPKRSLTMMMSGDPADLEDARPILESMSAHLIPVGKLGDGHLVKAVNNMIAFASRLALLEGLALCAKNGIDAVTVANVLVNGTGLTAGARRILQQAQQENPQDRGPGGFSIGLMTKDLRHLCTLTRDGGIPSLVADQAFHIGEIMTRELGYDADITESTSIIERWADVKIDGPKT